MAVIIVDDGTLSSGEPRSAALCRRLARSGIHYRLIKERAGYAVLTADAPEADVDRLAEAVAERARHYFEEYRQSGERVGFVIDCHWGSREDFGEIVLAKLLIIPSPFNSPIPASTKIAVFSIHAGKPEVQKRFAKICSSYKLPLELEFFGRLKDGLDTITDFLADCRGAGEEEERRE
jgi:hypothetical protein